MITFAPQPNSKTQPPQSSLEKNGEDTFLAFSSEADKPFFKPSAVQAKMNPNPMQTPSMMARSSNSSIIIQPKLTVGKVGDKYEQEADAMADKVVQKMDAPQAIPPIQKKCDHCEQEEQQEKEPEIDLMRQAILTGSDDPPEEDIQTKAASESNAAPDSLEKRLRTANQGGQPMNRNTRQEMESGFHADFSTVKIHTDSTAAQMNQELGAHAFTNQNHIYFNTNKYQTGSTDGKKLLAHELTHVVQQTGNLSQKNTLQKHSDVPAIQKDAPTDCSEEPMTRSEEITLSRTSSGGVAGFGSPFLISLYNYAIDSDTLKSKHLEVLAELGSFLNNIVKKKVNIRPIGHTSSTGSAVYNQQLSIRRAKRVKSHLETILGGKVRFFGAGEVQPVDTNETVCGRSRNRRVDILIAPEGEAPDIIVPPRIPDGPGGDTPPVIPPPPGVQPPGVQPPEVPPPGIEPPVVPPPGVHPPEEDTGFCEDHPILCGIIGAPIVLLPLVCLLNPELCLLPILPVIPPVIPPDTPTPPREPEPPEDPNANNPLVIFQNVRASNTPGRMNDRISDKDPVNVLATVTNQPTTPVPITISVINTSQRNGEAAINAPSPASILNTTLLQVMGTALTRTLEQNPVLRLQAVANGHTVGISNPFAVSAIMQDIVQRLDQANCIPGDGASIDASMTWDSDGANGLNSLSEVLWLEALNITSEEGGFTGAGVGDTFQEEGVDDRLGNILNSDRHGTDWARLIRCRINRTNVQEIDQLYRMKDLRSGSPYVPIRHSGYRIIRRVVEDPQRPGCPLFIVEKFGAAVSVRGESSAAGATIGTLRGECRLPCPPPPQAPQEPVPPEPSVPPTPQNPTPTPTTPPSPTTPPCDYELYSRLVDQCIEQTREDIIECHENLGIPIGWGGIIEMAEYWICLRDARERLLECDQEAKERSHCTDIQIA